MEFGLWFIIRPGVTQNYNHYITVLLTSFLLVSVLMYIYIDFFLTILLLDLITTHYITVETLILSLWILYHYKILVSGHQSLVAVGPQSLVSGHQYLNSKFKIQIEISKNNNHAYTFITIIIILPSPPNILPSPPRLFNLFYWFINSCRMPKGTF